MGIKFDPLKRVPESQQKEINRLDGIIQEKIAVDEAVHRETTYPLSKLALLKICFRCEGCLYTGES